MLSGDYVSNTSKDGLSPCGRVCCPSPFCPGCGPHFPRTCPRTSYSPKQLCQLCIVDSCSAVVLFSSFRESSRLFLLALFGLFFGCLYMQ